jgi:hypothetical protein
MLAKRLGHPAAAIRALIEAGKSICHDPEE